MNNTPNIQNKTSKTLLCFLFVAIIIIISRLFLVLLFSCGKSTSVCYSLMELFYQLALSYISAYIFWFISIYMKDKLTRKKHCWWIHDELCELNSLIKKTLDLIGWDKAFTIEVFNGWLDQNSLEEFRLRINEIYECSNRKVCLNLPWGEDEIELLRDIHNISYDISNTLELPIIASQKQSVYGNIQNLAKNSARLDNLANNAVK